MPSTRSSKNADRQPSSSKPSSSRQSKSRSKSTPAQTPEELAQTQHTQLLSLASKLHLACIDGSLEEVKRLFGKGAPGWYQEEDMGWSCLHFAAERGDWGVVDVCLKNGAVWNAMDRLGRTAGDISLSINDERSYTLIRNEGLRQEMVIHAMKAAAQGESSSPLKQSEPSAESSTDPTFTSSSDHPITAESADITMDDTTNTIALRSVDDTSAGDNLKFLKSELRWTVGEDGGERVLDEDGNGVMMGWETPLMEAHVKLLRAALRSKIEAGEPISVLNIGYGLGIIDNLLQTLHPANHTIIEAHPSVLRHLRNQHKFDQKPGVKILEGRWQDFLNTTARDSNDEEEEEEGEEWVEGKTKGIGAVLEGSHEGGGFDFVFMDTFAEGYEELKEFFEFLPDLLTGPEAVFSFWNGLGATNPLIYDVACNLAEMHLEDVGLSTTRHDVPVDDATAEKVWNGIKSKYWTLPVYRLPVCQFNRF